MGINTNLERLPLSQILSQDVTSVKRELVFTIETPFLADDIILTLELIEGEARRLLAGLKHFRHSRSFVRMIAARPRPVKKDEDHHMLTIYSGQCYRFRCL